MAAFAPALKLAQLAWRCAGIMFAAPLIPYQKAVPKVLHPRAPAFLMLYQDHIPTSYTTCSKLYISLTCSCAPQHCHAQITAGIVHCRSNYQAQSRC